MKKIYLLIVIISMSLLFLNDETVFASTLSSSGTTNSQEVLVKVGVAKLGANNNLKVRLSSTSVKLIKSKKTTLKLIGGAIKSVSTSNSKVATINKEGTIKAIKKGKCKVYIKGIDNKIYTCNVTVEAPYLNAKSKKIAVGDSFDLNLIGCSKSRKWSVKNKSIATVDNSGIVVGNKVGKTRVYCKVDGVTYCCDIQVVLKLKDLKDMNVSIIGDSISTFDMYIPGEYKAFYPRGDVEDGDYMWWSLMCNSTGMKILKNCSWSTSKVTGDSASITNAYTASSYKRIADLSSNGVKPDVIICYIGINDFGNCAPIGEWIYENNELQDSNNLEYFDEAYALMLKKIHEEYPDAKVMCCTLMPVSAYGVLPYSYVNKVGVSLMEYNYVIRNIARIYGDTIIDLYSCGLNSDNLAKYTTDGKAHPNKKGMRVIRNKIIKELSKYYK